MDIVDNELRATEETEVESDTEIEDQPKEEGTIDYAAELEATKKELQKKGKTLEKAEFTIEKLKSADRTQLPPDLDEIIERKVEERVQAFSNQVRGEAISSLIEEYSSNEDEGKLIKFHLENSIRPSGDDVQDIINAKALANKARLTQKASEIQRSLQRPEADVERGGGTKATPPKKQQYSAEEQRIMKMYNLTPEDMEKGIRR